MGRTRQNLADHGQIYKFSQFSTLARFLRNFSTSTATYDFFELKNFGVTDMPRDLGSDFQNRQKLGRSRADLQNFAFFHSNSFSL